VANYEQKKTKITVNANQNKKHAVVAEYVSAFKIKRLAMERGEIPRKKF